MAFYKHKHIFESPVDCKEIKPVNPKRNQFWIFIGRTVAKVEAPILWLPDVKSWLIGKEPDAGKDWLQKEKEAADDEIVRWHHWLSGHEFKQTLGDSEGQRSPWCCKELDMTVTEQQHTHTLDLAILFLGIYPWERKTYVHMNVYRNFIHSHTDLETTWITFNWQMNEQTRIHTGNAVLRSNRKKGTSLDIQ